MNFDNVLRPNEVIDRLKHAEKKCINGYYFVLIRPNLRDRIIELVREYEKTKEIELEELKEKQRVLLEQYDTAHKLITIQQKRIEKFESDKRWDEYPDRMGGGAW